MGVASKYNHCKFIHAERRNFRKLSELYAADPDAVYICNGVWVNQKGKFGPEPVVISNSFCANLPNYRLGDIQEMLEDEEAVNQINDGLLGFYISKFNRNGKDCYNVIWVDLPEHRGG